MELNRSIARKTHIFCCFWNFETRWWRNCVCSWQPAKEPVSAHLYANEKLNICDDIAKELWRCVLKEKFPLFHRKFNKKWLMWLEMTRQGLNSFLYINFKKAITLILRFSSRVMLRLRQSSKGNDVLNLKLLLKWAGKTIKIAHSLTPPELIGENLKSL